MVSGTFHISRFYHQTHRYPQLLTFITVLLLQVHSVGRLAEESLLALVTLVRAELLVKLVHVSFHHTGRRGCVTALRTLRYFSINYEVVQNQRQSLNVEQHCSYKGVNS